MRPNNVFLTPALFEIMWTRKELQHFAPDMMWNCECDVVSLARLLGPNIDSSVLPEKLDILWLVRSMTSLDPVEWPCCVNKLIKSCYCLNVNNSNNSNSYGVWYWINVYKWSAKRCSWHVNIATVGSILEAVQTRNRAKVHHVCTGVILIVAV